MVALRLMRRALGADAREQPQRVGARRLGERLRRHAARLGDGARRGGDEGRLVAAAAMGTGARYGASVSTRMRSSGTSRAMARRSSDFLNVTTPEKEIDRPRSSAVSASARDEVKQWRSAWNAPPHLLLEDRRGVRLRVARMDDERQPEFAGDRDLAAKDALATSGARDCSDSRGPPRRRRRISDARRICAGREVARRLVAASCGWVADGEIDVVVALRDLGQRGAVVDPVPMVIMRSTPAARARATTASSRRRSRGNRDGSGCR